MKIQKKKKRRKVGPFIKLLAPEPIRDQNHQDSRKLRLQKQHEKKQKKQKDTSEGQKYDIFYSIQ